MELPTGTIIFYSTRDSFYRLFTAPVRGIIQKTTGGFWEHCGIIINNKYYEVNSKNGLIEIEWDIHKEFLEGKKDVMITAYSKPQYQTSILKFQNDINEQLGIKPKYSQIRAFFSAIDNIKIIKKLAIWLIKKQPISKATFCSKFILKTLQTQPYLGELYNIDTNTISPNELKKILIDNKKLYSNLIIL
jgi:uncharacterized pyridoxamine 5'-phosphate oxidase family protein